MDNRSGWLYWPAHGIHVFRRDGSYEKTIKPFPSNLPADRVKASGAFVNDRGYLNPIIHRALGMTFYPFEDEPTPQMAVADGKLFLTVVPSQSPPTSNPMYQGTATHLAAIDTDGGIPSATYAGPVLDKSLSFRGEGNDGGTRLAASGDGLPSKSIYFVNIGTKYYDKKYILRKHHAVYRAPLPAMGPAEVFFGDKDKAGNDDKHLNEPMGVAVDGKGHLLIADKGNNRVLAINESDCAVAGSIAIDSPEWVAADPKTGAVYVYSKTKRRVVKFDGFFGEDRRQGAGGPGYRRGLQRTDGLAAGSPADQPGPGRVGGEPGSVDRADDGQPAFAAVRGQGVEFLAAGDGGLLPAVAVLAPGVGPDASAGELPGSTRREARRCTSWTKRPGQVKQVRVPPGLGNNQGITSRLDRDGNVYSNAADGGIWKSDPAGKMIPFPAASQPGYAKGQIPGGSSGTTAWDRDFYIRPPRRRLRQGPRHRLPRADALGGVRPGRRPQAERHRRGY